jgi:hypothetical protein
MSFICYFNRGGLMEHRMVRQSMTRFATEVMPHFRWRRIRPPLPPEERGRSEILNPRILPYGH